MVTLCSSNVFSPVLITDLICSEYFTSQAIPGSKQPICCFPLSRANPIHSPNKRDQQESVNSAFEYTPCEVEVRANKGRPQKVEDAARDIGYHGTKGFD